MIYCSEQLAMEKNGFISKQSSTLTIYIDTECHATELPTLMQNCDGWRDRPNNNYSFLNIGLVNTQVIYSIYFEITFAFTKSYQDVNIYYNLKFCTFVLLHLGLRVFSFFFNAFPVFLLSYHWRALRCIPAISLVHFQMSFFQA